ncbi:hypothetical protein [Sphingomonas sp. ID0503]|uniref:hypothetical protein n=1 Tax=Sphingomonas sp. ID0503 TaxID=3399691 RepID=UPI003AFB35D2
MQFLRTLFWMVVAVVLAAFAYRNWEGVPVHLWGTLDLVVKLPVLLLAVFLLGLIPGLILHRATLWRLRRRVEAERALAEQGTPPLVDPHGPTDPVVGAPIPAPAPPLVP